MRHAFSGCLLFYISITHAASHDLITFYYTSCFHLFSGSRDVTLPPSLLLSLSQSVSAWAVGRCASPSPQARSERGCGHKERERLRGFIDPERLRHLDLTAAACFLLFIFYLNSFDFLGLSEPNLPNHVWGSGGCEQAYRKHIQGERKAMIDGSLIPAFGWGFIWDYQICYSLTSSFFFFLFFCTLNHGDNKS